MRKEKKVFYITHKTNDSLRWFCRDMSEKYINIHLETISEFSLKSNVSYRKGEMKFTEVIVKETKEWLNYMFDNNRYIDESDFRELSKDLTTIDKTDNSFTLKEGDICIVKHPINGGECIFQVDKIYHETTKIILKKGFHTIKGSKVYRDLGNGSYCTLKEITRKASLDEVKWFYQCLRDNKVTQKPEFIDVPNVSSNLPNGTKILAFKLPKKIKTENKKLKLKLNKIKLL